MALCHQLHGVHATRNNENKTKTKLSVVQARVPYRICISVPEISAQRASEPLKLIRRFKTAYYTTEKQVKTKRDESIVLGIAKLNLEASKACGTV